MQERTDGAGAAMGAATGKRYIRRRRAGAGYESPSSDNPSCDAVLAWLGTSEASLLVRRRLHTSGFGGMEHLAEDVLSEAKVAVLRRGLSPAAFEVENPAAYGTTVVVNAVKAIARGEVGYIEDLNHAPRSIKPPPVDPGFEDEIRLLVEHSHVPEWLRSAVLAYVCFAMSRDSIPEDAPTPRSGARPDQALAWPALWYSGQRDLFPTGGSDPNKRKRGRRIEKVREHLMDVVARVHAGGEQHHG